MMILAVHTTTPRLSVAVTQDGNVLQERILPPGREHLENLAPVIQGVCWQAKINLEDLHGLGVTTGPGSFSGIRVGLATVKGLALALSKPVVGVSSLEILAWQGLGEGEVGAAVIDARRREIFTGVYRKSAQQVFLLQGPFLMKTDLLAGFMKPVDREVPKICAERAIEGLVANSSNALEIRIVVPSASACALLAEKYFKGGKAQDVHSIAPLYIRRSDAEEKFKVR